MEIDPVCGMEISLHEAAEVFELEGNIYCFCSKLCRDEFAQHPEVYSGTIGVESF